jgi:hypothetical protein
VRPGFIPRSCSLPSPPIPSTAFLEMRVTLFITAVSLAFLDLACASNVFFYSEKTCDGPFQYKEISLSCGVCINSPDEASAVSVGRVSSLNRVTVHNQSDCTDESVVLEVSREYYPLDLILTLERVDYRTLGAFVVSKQRASSGR